MAEGPPYKNQLTTAQEPTVPKGRGHGQAANGRSGGLYRMGNTGRAQAQRQVYKALNVAGAAPKPEEVTESFEFPVPHGDLNEYLPKLIRELGASTTTAIHANEKHRDGVAREAVIASFEKLLSDEAILRSQVEQGAPARQRVEKRIGFLPAPQEVRDYIATAVGLNNPVEASKPIDAPPAPIPPASLPKSQPSSVATEQLAAPEPTTPTVEPTPPPPTTSPEATETATSFPQVEPQEDLAVYLDQLADALEANGDARLDVDGRPQISFAKVAKKLRLLHDELASVQKRIKSQDAYELRTLTTRITNLPVPEDVGKRIAKQLGLEYSKPDSVRADMRVENTVAPVELKPMESKVPTSIPAPEEVASPQPFAQQEGLSLDALRERAAEKVEAPGAGEPPTDISPEVMQKMQVEAQPGAVAPIQVATAQEGAKPAETVNASPETSQPAAPRSGEAMPESAERQFREYWKQLASEKRAYMQAIENYHAAAQDKGLMKLMFSQLGLEKEMRQAREQIEQAQERYDALLNELRTKHQERVNHWLKQYYAREYGHKRYVQVQKRISMFEARLMARIDQEAILAENVRVSIAKEGMARSVGIEWAAKYWEKYRNMPWQEKVKWKVGLYAVAGAAMGAGGVSLLGSAALGGAGVMVGRYAMGATLGAGATVGTKLGLDKLTERASEKRKKIADASFDSMSPVEARAQRVANLKKDRFAKKRNTAAALGAGFAAGMGSKELMADWLGGGVPSGGADAASASETMKVPVASNTDVLPPEDGTQVESGVGQQPAGTEVPPAADPTSAPAESPSEEVMKPDVPFEPAPAPTPPAVPNTPDAAPIPEQQPADETQQLVPETAAEQPDSAAPEPQPAPEPAPAPQVGQVEQPVAVDPAEEPESAPQPAPAPEQVTAPQAEPQTPQSDTETPATGTSDAVATPEAVAEQTAEAPVAAQDQSSAESVEEAPATVAEVAEANSAAVATLPEELQQKNHLSWKPVRDMIADGVFTPEEHALVRDNWNWLAHVDVTKIESEIAGTTEVPLANATGALQVPPDAQEAIIKLVTTLAERDVTLKNLIVESTAMNSPMSLYSILETYESHDVSDFSDHFAELLGGEAQNAGVSSAPAAVGVAETDGAPKPEIPIVPDDLSADGAETGSSSGATMAPEEPLPIKPAAEAVPAAQAETQRPIDLSSVVEKPEAFTADGPWSIGGTYEAGDSVQGELQILLKGEFGVSVSDAGAIAHNLQERLAQEGGAYAEAFGVQGSDWGKVHVGATYDVEIPRELVKEVVTETLANKIDIPSAQLDVEIKQGDNLTNILKQFAADRGVPEDERGLVAGKLLTALENKTGEFTAKGWGGDVNNIEAGRRLQLAFSDKMLADAGFPVDAKGSASGMQAPAAEAPVTPPATPAAAEAPEPVTPPSEGEPADATAGTAVVPPATDPEHLAAVAEATKQQLPEQLTAQPGDPGYVGVGGVNLDGEEAATESAKPETSIPESVPEAPGGVGEGGQVSLSMKDLPPEDVQATSEVDATSVPEEAQDEATPVPASEASAEVDMGDANNGPETEVVAATTERSVEGGGGTAAELQQQLSDTDEALQSAQKAIDAANAATGSGQRVSAAQAPAGGESALDALAAQPGVTGVPESSGEDADASSAGAEGVSAEVPESSGESQHLEGVAETERPLLGMQPRFDSFSREQVNTYLETLGKADMQVENELPNRFEPVIERTGKQFEDVLKDEVFNTVNAEQRNALADVWEALAFMPADQLLDETDGLTYKVPTVAGTDISFTLDANTEKFVAEVVRGAAKALAGEDGDPQVLLTDAVEKKLPLYKLFEK